MKIYRALLATFLTSVLLISPWDVRAADDPNRTVGPQSDGSIVASSNQTLTPAGTIVDLGSPVVAKAVALNPKLKSAAVLLMGSAQPVIVFNTQTGQVLQRFIPTSIDGAKFTSDKAGSFTGITYSADGTRLFFSQDDNHVVIAKVDAQTGLLTNGQSVTLPQPPADGRPYHNAAAINPGVPNDLNALCAQLLRRNPVERPEASAILECLGAPLERASRAAAGISNCDSIFVGREPELECLHTAYKTSRRPHPKYRTTLSTCTRSLWDR